MEIIPWSRRIARRKQRFSSELPEQETVSVCFYQRTLFFVTMAIVATCQQVSPLEFLHEQKDTGKRLIISKYVQFDEHQLTGSKGNGDSYDSEVDSGIDTALGLEPKFDSAFTNVTVIAGQTVMLPCSIEDLGKYKVAWLEHLTSLPLTYEDRRVIDDSRFSVVRSQIKDWNLLIRDTKKEDNGQYRCTINTFPVKSKTVQLNVKVPAQIVDRSSSRDLTVPEGGTLRIVCNATGVPKPQVTWFRKSFPSSHYSSDLEIPTSTTRCDLSSSNISIAPDGSVVGEALTIVNVSRACAGLYECRASNEVPPMVSRTIRVTVEFPPAIHMTNPRIIQWLGRETILECQITAYPHAVNYWEKDGRKIMSSAKHRIEAYDEGDHRLTLSLRIHVQDQTDYGEYLCHASNSLGTDQKFMYLSEPEQKQPAEQLREHQTSPPLLPPTPPPSPPPLLHQPPRLHPVTEILLNQEDFHYSSGSSALAKHASSEYHRKGKADQTKYRVSNFSNDVIHWNSRNMQAFLMTSLCLSYSMRLRTY